MTDQRLQVLEARLTQLERAAKRWRLLGVSSLAGVLFLAAAPNSGEPRDLTVKSLLVKSPTDAASVRILPGTIEVERDGARVIVKTDGVAADGRAAVEVTSDGHESLLRSGRLALVDRRAELMLEGRADSLQLSEAQKEASVQLINRQNGAVIFVGSAGKSSKLRSTGLEVAAEGTSPSRFPAPR